MPGGWMLTERTTLCSLQAGWHGGAGRVVMSGLTWANGARGPLGQGDMLAGYARFARSGERVKPELKIWVTQEVKKC